MKTLRPAPHPRPQMRDHGLEVGLDDRVDWALMSVMDETATHSHPLKLFRRLRRDDGRVDRR